MIYLAAMQPQVMTLTYVNSIPEQVVEHDFINLDETRMIQHKSM